MDNFHKNVKHNPSIVVSKFEFIEFLFNLLDFSAGRRKRSCFPAVGVYKNDTICFEARERLVSLALPRPKWPI